MTTDADDDDDEDDDDDHDGSGVLFHKSSCGEKQPSLRVWWCRVVAVLEKVVVKVMVVVLSCGSGDEDGWCWL